MAEQPSLEVAINSEDAERAILVPSNRYNVLEILSSGVIAPLESYDKYYRDPLALVPGRIVLIADRLDAEVCEAANAESDPAFPVALELDVSRLKAVSVDAVTPEGKAGKATLGSDGALAWAPRSVLPALLIRSIHFRSEGELEEYSARKYENVAASPELVVSRERFGGESTGAISWLEGLGGESSDELRKALVDGDLRAAIATLVAAVLPGEEAWLMDWAAALKAKRPPKRTKETPLPSWITMLLAGQGRRTEEDKIVVTAAAVLRERRSNDAWAPREILEEVRDGLGPDAPEPALRLLEEAEAVVRSERDLRPLVSGRDPASVAGLLLFLLRPEPAELLAWPARETGADAATMATAATFAGLWHGYKRLAEAFKPPAFAAILAARTADRIDTADKLWDWSPPKFSTVTTNGGSAQALGLKAGRTIILERPIARIDVTRVLMQGDADRIRAAALEVCKKLGWDDCVFTAFNAATSRVKPTTVDGNAVVEVTVRGFAEPRYTLDIDRFRERLSEAKLEAPLLERIGDLLDP